MSARKAIAQENGAVSSSGTKKRAPRKRKSPASNTNVEEEAAHTPETQLIASLFARHETFIKQQETARTVFFKQLLADTLTFIKESKGAPAVIAPAPEAAVPEKAGKKKKVPRDPNMPKRAMSSYMLFAQDFRKEVAKNNPTMKNQGQIAKLTSIAWKQIDAEKKAKYVKQAEKLKEAYQKARGIYEKNKKLAAKKAAAGDGEKETPAVATSSPAKAAKKVAAAAAPEGTSSDSSDSEEDADSDPAKPVAKPVVAAEDWDSDTDTSDDDEEPAPPPPKPAKKQKKDKKEKSRKETAPTPSKKKKKHKRSKVE